MSNRRDLPRFAPQKPFRRNTESAAAANKKHFNHIGFPSCKGTICPVLPHFTGFFFEHILSKIIGRNGKSWQIVANRGRHS